MRHGILLIDKPSGQTSHDTVSTIRRVLGERSIGHLGTLDPMATGLLVLAVGKKACKVVELFKELSKEYEAELTLGAVSTTYDGEGMIEQVPPKAGRVEPTIDQVQNILVTSFEGFRSQVPPIFSAVHIDGKRAYELARKGLPVTLAPRTVELHSHVVSYTYPLLTLSVHCSSGTYIRSLAHDLGEKLRCGAYLSRLRRTKVGDWSVAHATTPENVRWTDVLPLSQVLLSFPKIDLTDLEFQELQFGRSIHRELSGEVIAWHKELPVAVVCPLRDGSRTARGRKVL